MKKNKLTNFLYKNKKPVLIGVSVLLIITLLLSGLKEESQEELQTKYSKYQESCKKKCVDNLENNFLSQLGGESRCKHHCGKEACEKYPDLDKCAKVQMYRDSDECTDKCKKKFPGLFSQEEFQKKQACNNECYKTTCLDDKYKDRTFCKELK